MGIKKSSITPEMLERMESAERAYYANGGLQTHEWYQTATPWIDRKLAGRIGRLEREEQGTFAQWLKNNGHENGFVWHGTHKQTTCHAGVPDFIIPVNGQTLYIEFKSPGGVLSIPQKNFRLVLEQQKYQLHIINTAMEAIDLVRKTKEK